jgi:hypothetical protein
MCCMISYNELSSIGKEAFATYLMFLSQHLWEELEKTHDQRNWENQMREAKMRTYQLQNMYQILPHELQNDTPHVHCLIAAISIDVTSQSRRTLTFLDYLMRKCYYRFNQ